MNSYFMVIGVGVSCRFSYSIVSYLYVSCSGSITAVLGQDYSFCYSLLESPVLTVLVWPRLTPVKDSLYTMMNQDTFPKK